MQLFQSSSHARLVAAVTAMLILPLQAGAQAGPQYSIGANAGLVMPVSDLGNFTSSGYQVAVTLGMHQPLTPLSFRASGCRYSIEPSTWLLPQNRSSRYPRSDSAPPMTYCS